MLGISPHLNSLELTPFHSHLLAFLRTSYIIHHEYIFSNTLSTELPQSKSTEHTQPPSKPAPAPELGHTTQQLRKRPDSR